ncbi:MAG: hypothetical protein ACOX60_05395 [Massiliimalia sp.]|jgi:hypothetical protein
MQTITQKEREYLRELAKKQAEYAALPIMEERKRRWYLHNSLQGEEPMVVMEEMSFLDEILPPAQCETPLAKEMERQLLQNILAYEKINDDKVMPSTYDFPMQMDIKLWQHEPKKTFSQDGLGYHIDPMFEDLESGMEKLKPSLFSYDQQANQSRMDQVNDVLGDILPVRFINMQNYWGCGITQKAVDIMGMENMFCSMMIEPDLFHEFMSFITDDIIRCLRWQEENHLIMLNNGNDYMGSGSYCFNHELETFDGTVRSINTWGHLNSQESIGISPELYHEFVYPYYAKLAKEFGLVYYGCCEPVDPFWDDSISKYENLRKVSISAWCNEEFMAERLSGSKIIYSRKPSPNFIGIEKQFDEDAFRAYIRKTMELTKNCKKEFIFRDIYKLNGNEQKVRRAVEIVREEAIRNS